jgi:hypothetical protein
LHPIDMALYDDSSDPYNDEIVFKSSLGFAYCQETKNHVFLQWFKDVVAFIVKAQVPNSYVHFISFTIISFLSFAFQSIYHTLVLNCSTFLRRRSFGKVFHIRSLVWTSSPTYI